jgi:UPF0716 protein FxsA
MPFLFIFMVLLPFVEIGVFIAVGEEIGVIWTLFLILLAGVCGGLLIQYQGFSMLTTAHQALREGRLPVSEVFDGICVVVAGILFIIPGFITDILAVTLLLPPSRGVLRRALAKRNEFTAEYTVNEGYSRGDIDVIETEYERLDEDGKP